MLQTNIKPEVRPLKRKKSKVVWLLLLLVSLLLLFLLAELFIVFPTIAFQYPLQTLSIPPKQDIGMDYYHESMGYITRTDAEIDLDLSRIRSITNKLKVYHNPFTSIGQIKTIVQKAKAQNMYVVWTENDDNIVLTDAKWPEYTGKVIADAKVAYSLGVNEFLVGNEISNHNNGDSGYNDVNLPLHVKQLVNDCKANFPGDIGYEDGWYKSDSWHLAGLGPLYKIYFTLFEPWHTFKTSLDQIVTYFGNKAEIGEIGTRTTKSGLSDDEQDWTRDLMRRYDYARQKKASIWLFTYKEPLNDGFGLVNSSSSNDEPHQIWNYLDGKETLSYHILLSNNFSDGTTQSFSGGGFNYGDRLRSGAFNDPTLASVPSSDYVFRGITSLNSTTGSEKWRATRIVFRYVDQNNYYFINIEPNDNHIQLVRRQNGSETFLSEAITSIALQIDYDFEIRISGGKGDTNILVFWNTEKIFDIVDKGNESLLTGKVGMKNNGIGGDFANVEITDFEKGTPRS